METDLAAGARVGDYQVVRKLAEGGMGEVFLVRNSGMSGEDLYVLKTVLCGSQAEAKDALKEAKALRGIQHKHVVSYCDVFPREESVNGIISICTVMEFCSRGDLAQHLETLRTHHARSTPLHQGVIVAWIAQMLMALVELHRMRIIHRDMKPQNVFLTSQGNLKIGDFGLATSLARGKVTSRVGTPSYIAPEVLQHEGYGPAVDVWGVGCLALELMTLEFLPERSEREGMLAMQVHTKPVLAKQMPRQYGIELRKIVASMLLVDPTSRPTAALALQRVEEAGRVLGQIGNNYNSYMLLQQQAAMTSGDGGWQPEESMRASLSHQQQQRQRREQEPPQPQQNPSPPQEQRRSGVISGSRRTPARVAENSMPTMRQPQAYEESDPAPEGGNDFVSGLWEGLKRVDVFGMWGGAPAEGSPRGGYVAPQPPESSAVRKAFQQALSEESLDGGLGDGMGLAGTHGAQGGSAGGGGFGVSEEDGGGWRAAGDSGTRGPGRGVAFAEGGESGMGHEESRWRGEAGGGEGAGRGRPGGDGGDPAGWMRMTGGESEGKGEQKVGRMLRKQEAVQVVEWESVTGADADDVSVQAPKPVSRFGAGGGNGGSTKHIAWDTVQGSSVNTQELGQGTGAKRSILREPKAHAQDSKSTLKLQEEERKRQMWEAARNPGRGAGQWVQGDSGALEWVNTAKLAEMERKKEKDQAIKARLREEAGGPRPTMHTWVGGAHAPETVQGVDLAARAKAELQAAPKRVGVQSVSERGRVEEELVKQEQKGQGLFGKITSFGRKKKGAERETTQGVDPWGNAITTPVNIPAPMGAGPVRPPPAGGSGASAAVQGGGAITRIVEHGPLKFRLTFDPQQWEQAREACQQQMMDDYLADLPPALRTDKSVLSSQVVRADDDAIDKQYRRMFGPPASKAI